MDCKVPKGKLHCKFFCGCRSMGCPPFGNSDSYGNVTTNEPTIKAWLAAKDATGNSNTVNFVHQTWNNSSYDEKFMNDEYILVIETMLNFQYSLKSGTAGTAEGGMTYEQARDYIKGLSMAESMDRARAATGDATIDNNLALYDHYGAQIAAGGDIYDTVGNKLTKLEALERQSRIADSIRRAVVTAIYRRYNADSSYHFSVGSTSSGGRQYFGTPILGTLPNVLDYRTTYIPECTSNWFASYTNKAAAFAEYITAGKAGERAGFRPWTGSTTEKLTDGQVKEYGVGLMVISAHDNITTDATHTWDAENCGSTPGKAPEYIPTPTTSSLSRSYTIIKAYRTLNTSTSSTSTYINDGVYTREDTIGKILIEDEPTYTVVDWFTTSTPTATVGLSDATRWNESKSHASIMEQGNSSLASPITLPSAQKYLYVLLECTHTSSPPTDANYTLLE